jgi:hypothetical protein
MGMMDDMKGKMSGMGDDAQDRYNTLMSKEQDGTITDAERDELMTLRTKMTDSGK